MSADGFDWRVQWRHCTRQKRVATIVAFQYFTYLMVSPITCLLTYLSVLNDSVCVFCSRQLNNILSNCLTLSPPPIPEGPDASRRSEASLGPESGPCWGKGTEPRSRTSTRTWARLRTSMFFIRASSSSFVTIPVWLVVHFLSSRHSVHPSVGPVRLSPVHSYWLVPCRDDTETTQLRPEASPCCCLIG